MAASDRSLGDRAERCTSSDSDQLVGSRKPAHSDSLLRRHVRTRPILRPAPRCCSPSRFGALVMRITVDVTVQFQLDLPTINMQVATHSNGINCKERRLVQRAQYERAALSDTECTLIGQPLTFERRPAGKTPRHVRKSAHSSSGQALGATLDAPHSATAMPLPPPTPRAVAARARRALLAETRYKSHIHRWHTDLLPPTPAQNSFASPSSSAASLSLHLRLRPPTTAAYI